MSNETNKINQVFVRAEADDNGTLDLTIGELSFNEGEALKHWYSTIGCTCVDIVYAELHGKAVDIVVDDEGLLKPSNTPDGNGLLGFVVTADNGQQIPLAGNLVFSATNEEGETISSPIDADELRLLLASRRIRPVVFGARKETEH